MPVIPIIIAAAATAGSAATAAAGAAAATAAAAGAAAAGAAAAAGTAVAAGAAAAGTAAAAITVTDVAVAGVAGVLAAKAKKTYDAGKKEEGFEEGARTTAARYNVKMEKIVASLAEAKEKMKSANDYFNLIIALTAVGMATAFADGRVTDDELRDLDEFTAGIAHTGLPENIKASIIQIKNNPPTLNTAMQFVNKLEKVDVELFDSVIQLIAMSDGTFCKDERALLEAFHAAAA